MIQIIASFSALTFHKVV